MKTTPFYQKALRLFTKTQEAQIQKGLAKYPEPFTPSHWTPDELLNHALEESVDLVHYLVGLKELLDTKDERIDKLHEVINEQNVTIARLKAKGNYDLNYNPPYFDPDDQ
jgi:hypothetical protein